MSIQEEEVRIVTDKDVLREVFPFGPQAEQLAKMLSENPASNIVFQLELSSSPSGAKVEKHQLWDAASQIKSILPSFMAEGAMEKLYSSVDPEKPIIYFSRIKLK